MIGANTKYDPDLHHRRSIRLKEYDYTTPGAYFVTICTHNKGCIFGEIENGKMNLNDAGDMVLKWWNELNNKCPNIQTDTAILMPNHFHGIINIIDNSPVGATLCGCPNTPHKNQTKYLEHKEQLLKKGQPHRVAPTG